MRAVFVLLAIAMYPASAGRAARGRAGLLDESQDELSSNAPFVGLASGSAWSREGITCAVHSASIHCANSVGHGFTMSPGHVRLL